MLLLDLLAVLWVVSLATLCGEKYGVKAVLINPAVAPHRMIESLIGDYINPYSGDRI